MLLKDYPKAAIAYRKATRLLPAGEKRNEAALGCAERQRQPVRRHAESAVLAVPQVATVASWGWLSGPQAAREGGLEDLGLSLCGQLRPPDDGPEAQLGQPLGTLAAIGWGAAL